jgi:hypothetical protein
MLIYNLFYYANYIFNGSKDKTLIYEKPNQKSSFQITAHLMNNYSQL